MPSLWEMTLKVTAKDSGTAYITAEHIITQSVDVISVSHEGQPPIPTSFWRKAAAPNHIRIIALDSPTGKISDAKWSDAERKWVDVTGQPVDFDKWAPALDE